MERLVYARAELVAAPPAEGQSAELLEGTWPRPCGRAHRDLASTFDGRYMPLDAETARLAAGIGESPDGVPDVCSLNALELRYYVHKLLRVVKWFLQVAPLAAGDAVELFVQRDRDDDYAAIARQCCALRGAALAVHVAAGRQRPLVPMPANKRWRRLAGRLAGLVPAAAGYQRARIVFCGNPTLLGAACSAALSAGAAAWWLVDRFALKAFVRWRPRGVAQLVCNTSEGQVNRLSAAVSKTVVHGVDLTPIIDRWAAARAAAYGAAQTRALEAIDHHFAAVGPDVVVLDEDATPFARAAVAMARTHGAATVVLQHGAPCSQFGFSPLAADEVFVWNQPSADVLADWGVPRARVVQTGWPQLERRSRSRLGHRAKGTAAEALAVLLTVPPKDDRPEPAALAWTPAAYAEMVEAVFRLARDLDRPLVLRPHPRASNDAGLKAARRRYPTVRATIDRGPFDRLLRKAGLVINCGSSAGVEAAAAGAMVLNLVPQGAGAFLSGDWGFAATATPSEVADVARVLLTQHPTPAAIGSDAAAPAVGAADRSSAAHIRPAAERIAELLLARADAVRRRRSGFDEAAGLEPQSVWRQETTA